MAIKTIINNTEKEIEQIKNSNEQDVDYVYSRIGDTEVEGKPPISIKSIGGNLADYRIYGQTSRNLFDLTKITENKYVYNGGFNNSTASNISEYIPISNGLTYTLSWNVSTLSSTNPRQIGIYDSQKQYLENIQYAVNGQFSTSFMVDIMNAAYIVVTLDKGFQNIMLNTGSNPLPYEPYGESVGDRTANLFDETIFDKNVANNTLIYVPIYVGDIDYVTCSTTCPKTITGDLDSANSRYIFILSGRVNTGAANAENGVSYGVPRTIQPSNGYVTIAYRKIESYNVRPWEHQTMLNAGTTVLPYEPYGYKVPVTVEGKNLLSPNIEWFRNNLDNPSNHLDTSSNRIKTDLIPVNDKNTLKISGLPSSIYLVTYRYYSDSTSTTQIDNNSTGIIPLGAKYVSVLLGGTNFNNETKTLLQNSPIQLEYGSTATPYELYQAPITTPIYLPKPIKKVGDEAEYIDYSEQKFHRISGANLDVTLPALSTIKGTNTFSVGTSIQPSNIYIKDGFDYKKVFTATRTIEDESPLDYRSIEDNDSTLSNYRIYGNTETVERNYSGTSPLDISLQDGTINNYRIYGQTVDGESVGDKTPNLFDKNTIISNKVITEYGTVTNNNNYFVSNFIPVKAGDYTLSLTNPFTGGGSSNRALWLDVNKENPILVLDYYAVRPLEVIKTLSIQADGYIQLSCRKTDENVMLNLDSVALPYEPYGYRVPVTVSNGTDTLTTPIYLPEQIKKVGDEAEYIDYGKQKQHRVRKNLFEASPITFTNVRTDFTTRKIFDKMYEPGTYTITLKATGSIVAARLYSPIYFDGSTYNSYYQGYYRNISFIEPTTVAFEDSFNIGLIAQAVTEGSGTLYDIMLNTGSTALPYEPYIENTEVDVTLPVLPTTSGTNVLSVDTSVKPSLITVSSDELVSVGDKVTSGEHTGEYKVPVTVEGNYLQSSDFEGGAIYTGAFYTNWSYQDSKTPADLSDFDSTRKRSTNLMTIIGTYTISIADGWEFGIVMFPNDRNSGEPFIYNTKPVTISDCTFAIQIRKTDISDISSADISDYKIMLNKGSAALPYGPYHAPVTTPIYLPYQIRQVGAETEYIDYGQQKQHRARKNLFNYDGYSETKKGITFTPNSDGSITCTGTAQGDVYHNEYSSLDIGTYVLNGTPNGLQSNAYLFVNAGTSTIGLSINAIDYDGTGTQFTATQSGVVGISIYIKSGYTCDNLTFYPMIRKADISDDSYEPYIENTDLDVTLPALPTLAGTNTLSVGTEVQPSKVYIKGKVKPIFNPYISGSLPFTFEGSGSLIRKYEFENDNNNIIGTKTTNLVPDLDGWFLGKALSSYGDVQDNKPTLMVSDFIEIESNTSYKFGAVNKIISSSSEWHRVVYFDTNKTYISFLDVNSKGTAFTTPSTAKYLRICTSLWYKPYLVKSSNTFAYSPYGYNIPIVLNNTTYQAYLSEPLGKKLVCENGKNVPSVTFIDGSTYNPAGGDPSDALVILGPTDNHYTAYGRITYEKSIDKYILGTTGTNTRLISPGTYTMCLTVHNPPSSNTWQISFLIGTYVNGQFYWRPCRCNSENTINGVATASYTFTIDDTNETQVSFAMIRFDTFITDNSINEWYPNTKVDISIIEGTEPVFATRTLINNNDEVIPIAEMPQLTTINGSNTIDVNITPKPTEVKLFLN